MTSTTIHAPGNDAHFMHVKSVPRRVRVRRGDHVFADSTNALRIMETGHGPYDPMIYIPRADVGVSLEAVEGMSTRCPLKGEASYFALDGEEIAWTYDRPLDVSEILKGHIAFYPNKVVVEEIGAEA